MTGNYPEKQMEKKRNMVLDNDQPLKTAHKPQMLGFPWKSAIQGILPSCISCVSTVVGIIDVFKTLVVLFLISLPTSVPILISPYIILKLYCHIVYFSSNNNGVTFLGQTILSWFSSYLFVAASYSLLSLPVP